jgi:hypothetical protein
MAAPERRVRHLRLVAGTEAAARAAVTRLEDALRCASLPDTGARLLLVRRLALGDLGREASSQTIARVIETRFADRAVHWTRGETTSGNDDAPPTEQVVFLSAWHARVALTVRLLRGESCTAWYWRLAVPEFRARLAVGDNIRSILQAIAHSPEAAAALPAWAVEVVRQAGSPALAAMVPAPLGEQLVRAAGLNGSALADSDAGVPADPTGPAPVPDWLRRVLRAGGQSVQAEAGAQSRPEPQPANAPGTARAHRQAVFRASATNFDSDPDQVPPGRGRHDRENGARASGQRAAPAALASGIGIDLPVSVSTVQAASSQSIERVATVPVMAAAGSLTSARLQEAAPVFDAIPTACAGLLFLLPVLARLGLPAWAERTTLDPGGSTRDVLRTVLMQLRMPRDDAIWAVLAGIDGTAPPTRPTAATRWLGALRRWLRQHAHISLEALVRRPGWIAVTPLHIDVFFRLADADMRLRRLGLDIDPGWLPWFGRVVAYHYGDGPRSA